MPTFVYHGIEIQQNIRRTRRHTPRYKFINPQGKIERYSTARAVMRAVRSWNIVMNIAHRRCTPNTPNTNDVGGEV